MSQIIVSHNSADSALARQVAALLQARGYSVYLDIDAAAGFDPGTEWRRALYRELRMCEALVVMWSSSAVVARWCIAEITFADATGKTIMPLRLGDAMVDPVLAERHFIQLTAQPDMADLVQAAERIDQGLRRAGIDPLADKGRAAGLNPYPGMRAFEADDARAFFGRRQETAELLNVLREHRHYGHPEAMLVITGASGVGKSSVLRAGLLPRLARDAATWRIVGPLRPQDEPVAALARAISPALAHDADAPAMHEALRRVRLADAQADATTLIVVDQFEELLHQAKPGDALAFVERLAALTQRPGSPVGRRPDVLVTGTLRAEYVNDFSALVDRAGAAWRVLPLLPITRAGLRAAVVEPARSLAGVEVEPELADAVMQDAEDPNTLPLVALVMERAWALRRADEPRLLREHYDRAGGIAGAVAQEADKVMAPFGGLAGALAEPVRAAFLAMARLDDRDRLARQRADWALMPPAALPVLQSFVDNRLLVKDSAADGRIWIEPTHEALFSAWPALREWLAELPARLKTRNELERDVSEWRLHGDEVVKRWSGERLLAAFAAVAVPRPAPLVREFLARAHQQEIERASLDDQAVADRRQRLDREAEAIEFDDRIDRDRRRHAYQGLDAGIARLAQAAWAIDQRRERLATLAMQLQSWRDAPDSTPQSKPAP